MNQFLLLCHGCVCDPVALQQQLDCTSSANLGIGMHCAKRLSHSNGIAELAMQHNSDRRIHRIFFLLAATAKNYASVTDRFTVDGRNMPTLYAGYILCEFCARQPA